MDSPLVPPVEDYDLTLLGAGDTFDANIIARPIASSDGVLCASPDYLRRNGFTILPISVRIGDELREDQRNERVTLDFLKSHVTEHGATAETMPFTVE